MATFTETTVTAHLRVDRAEDGTARITAYATSSDANGQRVRTMQQDITAALSAARVTGATALLDDIEARIRTLWGIG